MQNGTQAKRVAPPACGSVVGVMYPQAQEMAGTQKAVTKIEVIAQISIKLLKFSVHQWSGLRFSSVWLVWFVFIRT
jgi:hypothetical protein